MEPSKGTVDAAPGAITTRRKRFHGRQSNTRALHRTSDAGESVTAGGVEIKQVFLVPHPEMPQGQPCAPALLPAIDLSKIPKVAIR